MERKINDYINKVLGYMAVDDTMSERVKKDLYSHISEACEDSSLESVLERMGKPEDIAREFMETLYDGKDEIINRFIKDKKNAPAYSKKGYEYKSSKTVFGIPLIHINIQNRNRARPKVAKGIIAIGDVAIGFISIGGLALGLLSLGGISLGLIALGSIASGLFSIGGVSVGLLAIGGVSVGFSAIGGAAFGGIAIGGYANGIVAIGDKVHGQYALRSSGGNVSAEEVLALIKAAYPWLGERLARFISFFGSFKS